MTNDKDGKPLIDPVLEGILRQERADEAWADYVMNERPAALAEYLRRDGEFTEEVRTALIEALEFDTRGRKGGSKPFRDWQTYLSIENMLFHDSICRSLDRIDHEQSAEPLPDKSMSRRQALDRFAKRTGQELRAVERQYDRGAKIDAQFQ